MAALITGYGYPLDILFNSSVNDLLYRPVVAQVNNFSAGALKNSAKNIDGSVMAVE